MQMSWYDKGLVSNFGIFLKLYIENFDGFRLKNLLKSIEFLDESGGNGFN